MTPMAQIERSYFPLCAIRAICGLLSATNRPATRASVARATFGIAASKDGKAEISQNFSGSLRSPGKG
jgi:hypothetical protein